MAKKHMKRYSASLDFGKTQIKITMRQFLSATQITIIKNTITSVGEDVKKLEPLHTAGRHE